jgi:8-oxo-dGTP pyrophosphatase MutT (NUDIX family)
MQSPRIRPLALCLFRHDGGVLVNEARDVVKNQSFCRPIGGGIEFGETGATAVAREVREELSCEVTNLQLLGALENIFTYNGSPGHEIVLIYDGDFLDRSLYAQASIPGVESNGQPFQAMWRGLEAFSWSLPLYPNGLLELLRSSQGRHAR